MISSRFGGQASSIVPRIGDAQTAFPGVPIVYCFPNWAPGAPPLGSDLTGIVNDVAASGTMEAALRLLPDTRNIVVVGGTSYIDRMYEAVVREQLKPYERNYQTSYLTNLAMPDLVEQLKHLPTRTIVLLIGFSQDAAGTRFTQPGSSAILAAAANVPVFGLNDSDLWHGEVGGKLSSPRETGRTVGRMALRIFQGEKPEAISIVKSPTAYTFDWRALKRWGLKESDLPAGSIVVNRPFSVWDSYKSYIVGSISLMMLQAFLILGLLWQRVRRRKAESELLVMYDRLRLAVEAGKSVGWDWDIKRGRNEWFGDLQGLFGIPSDHMFVEAGELRERVHPEDRELVSKAIADARQEMKSHVADFRIVRTDNAVRWITATGQYYRGNGDGAERMLGIAVDITDRKEAEQAIADLSRKLVAVQEEERTRIARDLHDDINQQLAMISVEAGELRQNPPSLAEELSVRLAQLEERVTEVSKDVQSISHELHSPQLEYLGLVPAMKTFCREFAARHAVEIDFTHDDIPDTVAREMSLCLFRILQESLHNGVKHSKVRHFNVSLGRSEDQLSLTISDRGAGFDVATVMKAGGLGLVSMRERVRLINGTLAINSKPMGGTTIRAQVPFGRKPDYRRTAV